MIAARAYAARLGWCVLPLIEKGKSPIADLSPRGFLDATTDDATIKDWWASAPAANVGVACAASGFVAIDIDKRHGGDITWSQLTERHDALPTTPIQMTGGGGWHVLFQLPAGVRLRGSIGKGVDLKARGYIVVAPSVHPDGPHYRWDPHAHPITTAIAPMPAWLLDLARAPTAVVPIAPLRKVGLDLERVEVARRYLRRCPIAIAGSRGHVTAFVTAQKMVRGFDLDAATAFSLLTEWNARCEPPFSHRELARKITEAVSSGTMRVGEIYERLIAGRST